MAEDEKDMISFKHTQDIANLELRIAELEKKYNKLFNTVHGISPDDVDNALAELKEWQQKLKNLAFGSLSIGLAANDIRTKEIKEVLQETWKKFLYDILRMNCIKGKTSIERLHNRDLILKRIEAKLEGDSKCICKRNGISSWEECPIHPNQPINEGENRSEEDSTVEQPAFGEQSHSSELALSPTDSTPSKRVKNADVYRPKSKEVRQKEPTTHILNEGEKVEKEEKLGENALRESTLSMPPVSKSGDDSTPSKCDTCDRTIKHCIKNECPHRKDDICIANGVLCHAMQEYYHKPKELNEGETSGIGVVRAEFPNDDYKVRSEPYWLIPRDIDDYFRNHPDTLPRIKYDRLLESLPPREDLEWLFKMLDRTDEEWTEHAYRKQAEMTEKYLGGAEENV